MLARTDELPAADWTAADDRETAKAKLNLALCITGRRGDGYHTLDTLVVFAAVADVVTATDADGLTVAFEGPFASLLEASLSGAHDLVQRAGLALGRAYPSRRLGARLVIDKQLPIGGGIGGGSADAAATLRLLNRRWSLGLSLGELARLGLPFGADLPMCLHSVPLRGEGIGERITPLAGLPSLPVVLVNPGVPVSTRRVFARLSEPAEPPLPLIPRFASVVDLADWLQGTRNGLETAAREEAPAIGDVLAGLSREPDCLVARLSGSGATAFGIFPSAGAAGRAAERLRRAEPGWWVAATETGAA